MSTYRLLREESLDEGTKRIIGELADEAQGYLSTGDPEQIPDAVHETRKLCKKARGLARLVRPALADDYSQTNRLFRDAARELGPIRDPQAIAETFDSLAAVPGLLGGRFALEVRAQLAERAERATARVLENERDRIETASELIEKGRARSVGWDIPDEFEPMVGGVSRRTIEGGSDTPRRLSPGTAMCSTSGGNGSSTSGIRPGSFVIPHLPSFGPSPTGYTTSPTHLATPTISWSWTAWLKRSISPTIREPR